MTDTHQPLIELVVPVYNEWPVIEANLRQILSLAAHEAQYRISMLVVDDGSSDETLTSLAQFCEVESRARYVGLTTNFGKEAALMAGLDLVRDDADAVVLLDSDLQHPPELIPHMVGLWIGGAKVVEAYKSDRGSENLGSKLFANGFYGLFRSFAGLDLTGQTDFKLLDRVVVEQYRGLPERKRFFRGLIQWMHYPTARIPFKVPPRAGGTSGWSQIKLLRYALDNITAFSAIPLQLISWCGLLSLFVGILLGSIALVQKLRGDALDGFTTVILMLIFFSSLLMLSLGVIGQYLAHIYEEVKRRPRYILAPGPHKDNPATDISGPQV